MAATPRRFLRDAAGVSPVIGTILVLAISVLGVAGILAWGAPTISRIQGRNALVAMEGEFEGLRDAMQALSVPDHSRFPTVATPDGTLILQAGTRFLVTVDQDTANPACNFRITKWSDTVAKDSFKVSDTSGCRPIVLSGTPTSAQALLEVFSVGGTTTVEQAVTAGGDGVLVAGADFSKGDWMFRLSDGADTPQVYAQAWLHSTDQLAWTLPSSGGTLDLFLDGGAIFARSDGALFLQKEPTLGDTSFGAGYYGLWLRSLVATSYTAIEGQGSHQVFLSLLGNSVRADASAATRLRFDLAGPLAEAWCNALLARDPRLVTPTIPPLFNAVYTQDAGAGCAGGETGTGVRSVCYIQFTAAATAPDACTTTGNAFQFRFLHARIDASLAY